MKKFFAATLLISIIGILGAADTDSFQFIDHLLRREGPGKPEIVEQSVVFTAPSAYRRVGVAFANEGFGRVHWFQRLMIPNENASPWVKDKPPADMYRDSGMLFYIYDIPEDLRGDLEYRLVIDGLWVQDPLNPLTRLDGSSGVVRSVVPIPRLKRPDAPNSGPGGTLTFTYYASPGETVTVAGSFNNWDPFMYFLRETAPGRYSLDLPLPRGVYQYLFYHRGRRVIDTSNPVRVYAKTDQFGGEVSQAEVR